MSMPSIGNTPYGSLEFPGPLGPGGEQPSAGLGAFASPFSLAGDNVGAMWPPNYQAQMQSPAFSQGGVSPFEYGAAPSQGNGVWNSIAGLINGFGSFLQSSLGSIVSGIAGLGSGGYDGSQGSPSTAALGAYGAYGGEGNGCEPGGGSSGYGAAYGFPGAQQQYANASFQSAGDPHDAFNGTTESGRSVGAAWDDKGRSSHGQLLDSNSFAGGFRVSTVGGAPIDASGTHYNDSATITTSGGHTQVTYNKDGSYYVSSGGRNVPLTQGQTTSLGNGESVTLNADGSLTVNDANASGGNVSVTLATADNGSGVTVTGNANGVALGGYLAGSAESGLSSAQLSQQTPPSFALPQNGAPAFGPGSPFGWNAFGQNAYGSNVEFAGQTPWLDTQTT